MRLRHIALALTAAGLAFDASAIDGALDASFVVDSNFPGHGFYANPFSTFQLSLASAMAGRSDGTLWVVGIMEGGPGGRRISVYRTEPSGLPDPAFGGEDALGLRTYVKPCAGAFNIADVVIDNKDRLLVAVKGCGDFIVYRFKPSGDLDNELAGNGILTVPFDRGGDNDDSIMKITLTADDGIVMAGSVASATTRQLGIAHHDEVGAPIDLLNGLGQRVIPLEWSLSIGDGVTGLRVLSDGRIVAAGEIAQTDQGISPRQDYVVRINADGTMDGGFGNTSPGISKMNYKALLELEQSPQLSATWIGADGRVIHLGQMLSKQVVSDQDVFLAAMRPDGLPDLTVGPSGTRSYALDFAGPAPAMASNNSDQGVDIVPQGDGKFLLVTSSKAGDGFPGMGFVRLRSDLTLDPTFGIGGKARYITQLAVNGQHLTTPRQIAVHGGRILAVGNVRTGGNTFAQTVIALENDLLFADRFDD